ncbi:hypothetical protein BD410DRAFT_801555 [Rickenella mellea]|uniref:HMA domain-containing protein n=1 Tax=Rickenella mellea TaxID=50990 RepID=A0A4Y7QCG8_9AGAM|nr:hypothetical protein BD410DRAFT_801555 [Rickenella mellea]
MVSLGGAYFTHLSVALTDFYAFAIIKAESAPVEHKYLFEVVMSCDGCSGAINRVLNSDAAKKQGVTSAVITREKQEVLVTGWISYEDVEEKIRKTGKKCVFGAVPTDGDLIWTDAGMRQTGRKKSRSWRSR